MVETSHHRDIAAFCERPSRHATLIHPSGSLEHVPHAPDEYRDARSRSHAQGWLLDYEFLTANERTSVARRVASLEHTITAPCGPGKKATPTEP